MTITPGFRRIFKALVMNPVAPEQVERYDPGFVIVAGDKFERLTGDDPRPEFPSAEFVDLDGKVILPGFVDTHVHLPQFGIMGVGKGELLTWLNTYTYPEETRFADPEYAARISEQFFSEMTANGTTTAAIYSSVHEQATDIAFSTAQAKGLRAFIGKVMMDQNSPPALQEGTEDSLAASLRLFDKWDGAEGGRLRYVFTPRYAAACSMDLMKRVGDIASERRAFVQSHLSENRDEVEWVRKLFPDAPSYTAVYDAAGMLSDRCIMAHCIHLSSDEIDLLARTQTKVAFCPYSNRTLQSGTMPYMKLRKAGLTIGLGTDIAGGPSLSMLEQIQEAMKATGITFDEALYLGTLGGAKTLGLADHIGSLDAGKDADFVVADPALRNKHSITAVYVRGKLVYF
jgi:guanine deaminase